MAFRAVEYLDSFRHAERRSLFRVPESAGISIDKRRRHCDDDGATSIFPDQRRPKCWVPVQTSPTA